jgi:hypothetical protein
MAGRNAISMRCQSCVVWDRSAALRRSLGKNETAPTGVREKNTAAPRHATPTAGPACHRTASNIAIRKVKRILSIEYAAKGP